MDLKNTNIAKIVENLGKRKQGDKNYEVVRSKLEEELRRFVDDSSNMGIVDNVMRYVNELEGIEMTDVSSSTFDRTQTNVVQASARVRRTHYAAYMAGKWSNSDEIGDDFKCWMHNSAADGAISLANLLDHILKKKTVANEDAGLVKVFRASAYEDAARFLDLSKPFAENSPLTKYNIARLDILSKEKERRRIGIDHLKNIQPPHSGARRPELSWHQNNYDCFRSSDFSVRQIIQTHDPDSLPVIEHRLEENANIAKELVSSSSWTNQTQLNRVVMVSFSVGVAGCSYLGIDPDALSIIQEFIQYAAESLPQLTEQLPSDEKERLAGLGDGGLAFIDGSDIVRATFGDGGLA